MGVRVSSTVERSAGGWPTGDRDLNVPRRDVDLASPAKRGGAARPQAGASPLNGSRIGRRGRGGAGLSCASSTNPSSRHVVIIGSGVIQPRRPLGQLLPHFLMRLLVPQRAPEGVIQGVIRGQLSG